MPDLESAPRFGAILIMAILRRSALHGRIRPHCWPTGCQVNKCLVTGARVADVFCMKDRRGGRFSGASIAGASLAVVLAGCASVPILRFPQRRRRRTVCPAAEDCGAYMAP
jgi:hypothetical protein